MMQIKSLILLSTLNLFIFTQDVFAECIDIPTCESLGYTYTEEECKGIKSLVCPFDSNKFFCPEDCQGYELDECDSNIGTCRQCARNGKWKYLDCDDNDGFLFSEGNCTLNKCLSSEGFTIEKLNPAWGIIETCTKGTTPTYRYKEGGCTTGWYHVKPSYRCLPNECTGFDTNSVICPGTTSELDRCDEACPDNATCDEKCKSGTQIKAKIVCEDGYFLQDKGDIEGELYKCRKHKIGNIAFYCKDKSKIQDLASELATETDNTSYAKIDDNNDQIISLEPEYYEKAKSYDCHAIGVVFYNDTTTKIVGLKNLGYSSSAPYFTEQRDDYNPTAAWSSCYSNTEECNTGVENTTTENYMTVATDGADNTDKIIAWLGATAVGDEYQYTAEAAQATRAYYPRLCTYYDGKETCEDICPYVDENSEEPQTTSACSNGNWYLPSVAEINILNGRSRSSASKAYKSFEKIDHEYNVGFDIVVYIDTMHSSSEASNSGNYMYEKAHNRIVNATKNNKYRVRPVLTIE